MAESEEPKANEPCLWTPADALQPNRIQHQTRDALLELHWAAKFEPRRRKSSTLGSGSAQHRAFSSVD